jgi:hypothetical protein
MRILSLLVLLICCMYTAKAQPTFAGDTYITINGGRYHNQKLVFSKAEGDWFSTPKDAHVALTFSGNYNDRLLTLTLECDGKGETHTVTDEIRHIPSAGEFLLTIADKEVYGDGLNAAPSADQQITIHINAISEAELIADVSGNIGTGNDVIAVAGNIHLKKPAGKPLFTSPYKDCDNIIHDKFPGAQNRSPSECEIKFEMDTRKKVLAAFAPAFQWLQKNKWNTVSFPDTLPITGVARQSEKAPFQSSYELKFQLSSTSAGYVTYTRQSEEIATELQASHEKGDDMKPVIAKAAAIGKEITENTNVSVYVYTNVDNAGLNTFKTPITITRLSANALKLYAKDAQALSGGGEENAVSTTLLLIGKWKQPVIEKNDEGETVRTTANIEYTVSNLRNQVIIVRVEGSKSITDELLNRVDMDTIMALSAL